MARGDQILVCAETARLVEHMFVLEKIPSSVIRGLDRTCDIYSVLGRKGPG